VILPYIVPDCLPSSQGITVKQSIVTLFLSRFALTDEETEILTSRDVVVGRRFFDTMSKTERIRQDCRVLMAGEDGPTQVGLDIMSSTSSNLEQAYEKIFRWCSFEFRQMGRDVQVEVSPTMREAVSRLRQRQELLRYLPPILNQIFLRVHDLRSAKPSRSSHKADKRFSSTHSQTLSLAEVLADYLAQSNYTPTTQCDTSEICSHGSTKPSPPSANF
jgi:hypothetical protein